MSARLVQLLLAALAMLLCTSCSEADDARDITAWTVLAPVGVRRPVALPGRFGASDLDARGHVELQATASVPPAWRGRPLTLAITYLAGEATLRANGVEVPPDVLGTSRSWSVGVAAPEKDSIDLILDFDARPLASLPSTPRLSPTHGGDSRFRLARAFNFVSGVASGSILFFLAVLYAILFWQDRSRLEHGWVALQIAASIPIGATHTGLALRWLGPSALVVSLDGGLVAVVAAHAFMQSYFRRGRSGRAWFAVAAGAVLVSAIPRTATARAMICDGLVLLCVVAMAELIGVCVAAVRAGRDRFAGVMLCGGWLALFALAVPDSAALAGIELGGGVKGIGIGTGLFGIFQAFVLGRDHIRSLREAEARVKELEARGRELEARSREVNELNEELRHQVAERSRELTEALARSEGNVAPAALEVGDVFDGRYQVTRALGQGGMGAVYEVERKRDAKRFALKVVMRELSGRAAARFAREAEIGARVRHENLVSIVDVGIAAGTTPFLVMELVQGGSLEEQRPRFGDAKWALPLLRQIAAGLAELHANRIVHRDLKPGNVLLVERNGADQAVAKISDFGISRFGALDESGDLESEGATVEAPARAASPRDLTQTGALMGTPLYMPPEAWFGPARHPSADLFSLGILAYEALTGRSPFAVPPVILVRSRQPIPEPAPLECVSREIAALLLACLRVEPSARPRAREIADRL